MFCLFYTRSELDKGFCFVWSSFIFSGKKSSETCCIAMVSWGKCAFDAIGKKAKSA